MRWNNQQVRLICMGVAAIGLGLSVEYDRALMAGGWGFALGAWFVAWARCWAKGLGVELDK